MNWNTRSAANLGLKHLRDDRDTMQEKALHLMGRKMAAAQALEGRFSEEGLTSLASDDGDQMALAKTMFEKMDRTALERVWKKVAVDVAKEEDDEDHFRMTGPDLVKRMRQCKVTVAALAAAVGVLAKRVTLARKEGLNAVEARAWCEHLVVPTVKLTVKKPARRSGGTVRMAAKAPRAKSKRSRAK